VEAPAAGAARRTDLSWCLVLERDGRSGGENMALDHSLLRTASEGVAFLRLYRWSPPCLSFGRNEPARTRYDADAIARLGLDTVRRPTGGRAVWHEAEVTYAVAGPADLFGSLREAYIRIHTVLAAALRRLGADTRLAPRGRGGVAGPGGGPCFASPVGGEVVVAGRKLVGSAQVREGGAFLQHGSILLEDGQDVVARVARGRAPAPAASSLRSALARPVGFDEAAAAIAAEARRAWSGAWRECRMDAPPDELARFRDAAWTWRR
jgi:lipoate-protein ligase A